jgi:hypothetical protein
MDDIERNLRGEKKKKQEDFFAGFDRQSFNLGITTIKHDEIPEGGCIMIAKKGGKVYKQTASQFVFDEIIKFCKEGAGTGGG